MGLFNWLRTNAQSRSLEAKRSPLDVGANSAARAAADAAKRAADTVRDSTARTAQMLARNADEQKRRNDRIAEQTRNIVNAGIKRGRGW